MPVPPHSEWFAILEPVAAAFLAELGVEREPEYHALTQVEKLADIRRNHDLAVEWCRRGKVALGMEPLVVDAIQPMGFVSFSVMASAPVLPRVPKAFLRNRPPVPDCGTQLESARAQLAAWQASGQTVDETEQLVWWVHPSDLVPLREAMQGPRLLGLFVVNAAEPGIEGKGPQLRVESLV